MDEFVSKERTYLHFDLALSKEERTNFQISDEEIQLHSYWPLLGYVEKQRRPRKDENDVLTVMIKERPIKFGSHSDAAIYEFYGQKLSRTYEQFVRSRAFSKSVLASRSGVGNNIDHAKAMFDEIRLRRDCLAIAIDISGFFDNIRHDILHRNLKTVFSTSRLDNVDFFIFKRMTRFEWVDSERLRSRLGAKYGRSGRICRATEFRNLVRQKGRSLIERNNTNKGIPQGTPLSGLYANISLCEFDEIVFDYVTELGGSYRRYSDDIGLVLPAAVPEADVIDFLSNKLAEIGLRISPDKTEVSSFQTASGTLSADKPFQYLGFMFDGRKTLIRPSSLNRYYSKMRRGVRAKFHAARRKEVPPEEIYMRQLFKKYTHFGRGRNFPRYAYRAAKIMQAPEIKRQLSGHMKHFERAVKKAKMRVY